MVSKGSPGVTNSKVEDHSVSFEKNIPVRMRDGVTLYCDVFRPAATGKFPVILHRNPYNKSRPAPAHDHFRMARRGYVVVLQDCRGRYMSGGDFNPFYHEGEDGFDTIEWAASLSYGSGKVGCYGDSYGGVTQWYSAGPRPPSLVTIIPGLTGANLHDGFIYQGGALQLGLALSWTMIWLVPEQLRRRIMTHDFSEEARFRPLRNFSITRHLSFPDREIAPYFYDWMEHPSYDNYWAQWNIDLLYPEISIPCLNIAGWYDCFQTGAIRNFCGVSAQGQTSEVKAAQRLFVGPYGHASPTHGCHHPVTMLREMDPGPGALVDFTDLCLRWFDYWLKGIENGAVRYFTFGSNQWEAATSWPVKGTRFISYYLHSRGQANGLGGDGTLSLKEPGVEDPDRFVYDPDNPVPTIGGSLCCADEFVVPRGPHDQREVEKGPDVLVYSSNLLKEDLQVTGAVEMILHAASTALDTDFTVKLIDVFPSGYARNLTDGILRARYRSSMSAAQLMEPNSIYEFRIQAGSVSNIFRKGHSIRLEISSSNFPRFDRNPNTGRTIAEESESIKARNTIFHDQQRPSCLILPVISSEES